MNAPDWVDRKEYPFASHFVSVDGGRMHYVDEGNGPVVLLVHGTPTWSFLYRRMIKELSRTHRVIAPDNIGFGLSDHPKGWSYRPEDHARNLRTLIDTLGLEAYTLVVHDFGGPIGLGCALERPEQVESLVLFNTFLWSTEGSRTAVLASRFFSSSIGRFLYTRLNFSPRVLIPMSFADRRTLRPEVHRHYLAPFPTPESRFGSWRLAEELVASGAWFESLWERRERLAAKPALLLWGVKDPAFGTEALERWARVLTNAEIHRFDAGHFVQEEVEGIEAMVARFLETAKASA
jgi:pimeloyl-ACP methyl ester carboxylesterase